MNSKSISNYQTQARSKLNNNDTRNSNSKKVSTPINPSLVITRKKRKKDAITEMKEIVLKALPGGSTSVALTLGNNRPGVIILKPKAILVRYEPSRPVQVNEQCGRDLNVGSVTAGKSLKDVINRSSFVEDAAIVKSAQKNGPLNDSRKREEKELELEINRRSIFTVTPDSLIIIPGSENVFQITFSPALSSSGVYSGALKINAGNKVNKEETIRPFSIFFLHEFIKLRKMNHFKHLKFCDPSKESILSHEIFLFHFS